MGWVGVMIVVTGMAGSLLIGFFLDRFHRYKSTPLPFLPAHEL